MKYNLLLTIIFFCFIVNGQNSSVDKLKIEEDFNQLLGNLSQYYVYGKDKKIDFKCLKEDYLKRIETIKTEDETVLFFEYFLDEFYDSHLILNTNRNSSYRLYAPIYITIQNDKAVVTNTWQTQIENLNINIIGAEVLKFNGNDMMDMIDNFPTICQDKNVPEVREWIINKILSGRYNEPRVLILKLKNGAKTVLDLDALQFKKNETLLSVSRNNNVGVIRINNSLGNDDLVKAFDKALDSLLDTDGLILDLRNTVDGGDSYEARGIMSRFINEPKPYQKHALTEYSQNNPGIERSWVEYVSPRLTQYKKPVVILVGRWTGSMGEGLAIGFEGMERGTVVGTEMERLAGEISFTPFKHQNYGYRVPAAKLFHVNGTPREKYEPTQYAKQTTMKKDETLEKGMELILKSTHNR